VDNIREGDLGTDAALEWMEAQLDEVQRIHVSIRADVRNLAGIASAISKSLRAGGRVFFFGNGGSAADAQHWAAELSGRFYLDRQSLPAIALTANSSQLTAIGNDYGFTEVFSRPLRGLGTSGDVAVAISTSGSSQNVLEGVRTAKEIGMATVAFTGAGESPLKDECELAVSIPSTDVARIQEGHELCAHLILALVERTLQSEEDPESSGQL
jgi:D-sedoheptulose 7-phosphate isomerase